MPNCTVVSMPVCHCDFSPLSNVIVVLLYKKCKNRKKKYSESFKPSKAENNKDVNLARVDMEMFPVEVEENVRGSEVCSHCSCSYMCINV